MFSGYYAKTATDGTQGIIKFGLFRGGTIPSCRQEHRAQKEAVDDI